MNCCVFAPSAILCFSSLPPVLFPSSFKTERSDRCGPEQSRHTCSRKRRRMEERVEGYKERRSPSLHLCHSLLLVSLNHIHRPLLPPAVSRCRVQAASTHVPLWNSQRLKNEVLHPMMMFVFEFLSQEKTISCPVNKHVCDHKVSVCLSSVQDILQQGLRTKCPRPSPTERPRPTPRPRPRTPQPCTPSAVPTRSRTYTHR